MPNEPPDSDLLPIEQVTRRLLELAGAEIASDPCSAYDSELTIEVLLKAKGADYVVTRPGVAAFTKWLFSGASVYGTITWNLADGRKVYGQNYEGSVEPSDSGLFGSKSPENAPYQEAFSKSHFSRWVSAAVGQLFGADALVLALEDDNEYVAHGAARALGDIDSHAVGEALYRALAQDGSRQGAMTALQETEAQWVFDLLVRGLDDDSVQIRRAAARVIDLRKEYKKKKRRYIEPLIDTLDDPDAEVRDTAWKTLQQITDQSLQPDARVWNDWLQADPFAAERMIELPFFKLISIGNRDRLKYWRKSGERFDFRLVAWSYKPNGGSGLIGETVVLRRSPTELVRFQILSWDEAANTVLIQLLPE